jgi:nucleoside-diphosphate-sugar epimerase
MRDRTTMGSDLVLVTGASGYVAGHCILRLLTDGYKVRGTLRSLKRAGEVRQWLTKARGGSDPLDALSFVEAELTAPEGWDVAMEGVRYVLHVASPLPSSLPKHPDDLIVPAREGTLNVMRAASRASVERVVQTSSSTAILYGRDDPNSHLFTEADWTDPDHQDNVPYTRSKTIAERAAWAELPKLPRPLQWVAINPGLVLGPVLDKDSSASVQIVAKLLKGEIPGLPRLGYAVVDVRDLADLEVRAMTAPQAAGQRYIGSGPFMSMSEIAHFLKERLGDQAKKVPTRKLPDWLVRIVGLFDSEVRGQLFELGKVRRLSSAKAEKERGWSSRPIEETIMDTATSLKAVGALS